MPETHCEIPAANPPDEEIVECLKNSRKIAVIGLSPKHERDSNKVARYLLEQGYEVIPVNPGQKEILGKPCYKNIEEIPFQVDIADLFVNPKRVPSFVDQAIDANIPYVWMQLGVVHNGAADKARKAGIKVFMDMCIKVEHMKKGLGNETQGAAG